MAASSRRGHHQGINNPRFGNPRPGGRPNSSNGYNRDYNMDFRNSGPNGGGSAKNHRGGGSNRGPRLSQQICIGEEVKIAIHLAVERFRLNEKQKDLEFPSSFTCTERAYIHRLCQTLGLKSKSRGKKADRFLTIYKTDNSAGLNTMASFDLARNSRHQITSLLQRFPFSSKEKQELQPQTQNPAASEVTRDFNKTTTGRLNNGVPQVPPKRGESDLTSFREGLPIQAISKELVTLMVSHQIVLVAGETGSGKTTQVPQMILDDCHARNKPCRIFCTQPRRIAAISIAERVAQERGEKLGQTVGYQIRLESKVSPKTLLTFCTNGVLLRTLMGSESSLNTVTHIIVDEIHERDRFSDFLLIALKELLPRMKHLHLVLMSAALNIELFIKYFNNCPVACIPGTLYSVDEYFLEDVLKTTKYSNKEMEKYLKDTEKMKEQQQHLTEWCTAPLKKEGGVQPQVPDRPMVRPTPSRSQDTREPGEEREDLEPALKQEMDRLLGEIWLSGDESIFSQIVHLIMSENITVDYMHSETSVTALMIAAGRGLVGAVEQLLTLGASPSLRASNNWNAIDWAKKFNRGDIVDILEAHLASLEVGSSEEPSSQEEDAIISEEDRRLLSAYHHSFDDEKVDIQLLLTLVQHIHNSGQEGAILVFLPGYDEIVTLRDRITEDKRFENSKYALYTLHSSMQSSDQRRVFRVLPSHVRKIVLSTNIAESSITINDIVFVIDTGKVKEKTFDALSSVTMLKANWISKASALQRKGRAGRCRPGVCYHLFSRVRYNNMMDYQQPEILRYPLQELCLHTKLLAPSTIAIADFLAKAPEPPAFLMTRNAVQLLKQIDALDPWEELTELGHHLADLPVEPRLGKMVLYSVILKCLDPILTVICSLAYKDPFMLPAQPFQKRAATAVRRKFAACTHSDHMALLRAFQAWQKARAEGWEKAFCDKNFISSASMEMIVGMRTQLLGQLRASGFVRTRGGGDIRDLNTNSENWAVVKAALCAGMYPNIICADRDRGVLVTQKGERVRFHSHSVLGPSPNSVLSGASAHAEAVSNLPSDWLIYEEMTRIHRTANVRCCTLVSAITVAIFAGPAKLSAEAIKEVDISLEDERPGDGEVNGSDSEDEDKEEMNKALFRLDDWLAFRVDKEAANLTLQLRQKWHSLFLRRMKAPAKPWSQMDEAVVRAVINVLTNEEQALGLQQPAGIGQRPRPMSSEGIVPTGSGRGYSDTEDWSEKPQGRFAKRPGTTPPKKPGQTSATPRPDTGGQVNEDGAGTGSGSSQPTPSSSSSSVQGSNPSPLPSSQHSSPTKWADRDPGANTQHPNRFFVMKCNNQRHLDISLQKGIWATSSANEKKLNKAIQDGKMVYLIFSIQGSGHFQGYAKMTSEIGHERSHEFSSPGLSGNFSIEWVKRTNVPFQATHHLTNPWNENKRVQVSRDGQELEPTVGEALIKLWERFPSYQPRPYLATAGSKTLLKHGPGSRPTSASSMKDSEAGGDKPTPLTGPPEPPSRSGDAALAGSKPGMEARGGRAGSSGGYRGGYGGPSSGGGGYPNPSASYSSSGPAHSSSSSMGPSYSHQRGHQHHQPMQGQGHYHGRHGNMYGHHGNNANSNMGGGPGMYGHGHQGGGNFSQMGGPGYNPMYMGGGGAPPNQPSSSPRHGVTILQRGNSAHNNPTGFQGPRHQGVNHGQNSYNNLQQGQK